VLIASGSGLGAFAPSAFAAAPPAGDLAYLRLLIAAELLGVDFYTQALAQGDVTRAYGPRVRRILADESEHYTLLAALMTAAGQTPATSDDIDFSYPGGVLLGPAAALRFANELERMLVGSYIDALENVQTPAYRQTMAQILANEARHQGALAGLQGAPPIGKTLATQVSMAAMSDFLDIYES
jgi:hypothetical protein